MVTATVANVHRGDDRNVGRMPTWLYCWFRECPPGSADMTAGLMVKAEVSS